MSSPVEPRVEYLALRKRARQGLFFSLAALPISISLGLLSSLFIGAWGYLVFLISGATMITIGNVKRATILGAGHLFRWMQKYTMDFPPALKCEKCGTPAFNAWLKILRDICPNCKNDNRIRYRNPKI